MQDAPGRFAESLLPESGIGFRKQGLSSVSLFTLFRQTLEYLCHLFTDMKDVDRPASRRGCPEVLNSSECYNGWAAGSFWDSGSGQL